MTEESIVERGDSKGAELSVSLDSMDDATHNDQNDMARMGKPQQFKVGGLFSSSFPEFYNGKETVKWIEVCRLIIAPEKLSFPIYAGVHLYLDGDLGIYLTVSNL